MTKEDWQIILEVGAILIGLYLAFFKSYFQEKGKNLATKEDIEDITEKIENVKSEVSLLTHRKINIATEKHKTLLDFNNNYSAWLNYILHTNISGDDNASEAHIEKVKNKLDQLFHDYLIAEAKLEVFFNVDSELLDLKNDIKLKTIELSNNLRLHLVKAGVESKHISITNELPDNDYKWEQLKKYNGQLLSIIKEHQKEQMNIFKNIAPLNHQFIKLIADRVMTISK